MKNRFIIPRDEIQYDEEGDDPLDFSVAEYKIAQLLMDDQCHINTDWWKHRNDEIERDVIVRVNISDVFDWGVAESEALSTMKDLHQCYEAHMADPQWGTIKWAITKRMEMPIKEVLIGMEEDGCLDADFALIIARIAEKERNK